MKVNWNQLKVNTHKKCWGGGGKKTANYSVDKISLRGGAGPPHTNQTPTLNGICSSKPCLMTPEANSIWLASLGFAWQLSYPLGPQVGFKSLVAIHFSYSKISESHGYIDPIDVPKDAEGKRLQSAISRGRWGKPNGRVVISPEFSDTLRCHQTWLGNSL